MTVKASRSTRYAAAPPALRLLRQRGTPHVVHACEPDPASGMSFGLEAAPALSAVPARRATMAEPAALDVQALEHETVPVGAASRWGLASANLVALTGAMTAPVGREA